MIFFERSERAITRFAAGFAIFGGLGLFFATVLTCVSISLKLLRRILDAIFDPGLVGDALPWLHAILGEEELVTYGVGLALFAALPWVMLKSGHVRIDLLEPIFGRHLNHLLNLVGDLTLAGLAYLIMTRQWFLLIKKARGSKEPFGNLLWQGDFAQAAERLRTSQESQILGVPMWPTYIVAELCVIAFFIVACFCVWRSLRTLILYPHARP